MIEPQYIYEARVRSVYDGDTIRADIDLGFHTWQMNQPIRLWGVNTPEVRGPERPDGLIVKEKVEGWLEVGSEFILRSIADRTGKFGRILGICYPKDWEWSVNTRLIKDGLASVEAYSESERRAVVEVLGLASG